MPFSSLAFAIFAAALVLAVAVTPPRWRWTVLLTASYVFYGSFGVPYLPGVLLLVTAVSYLCGLALARSSNDRRRRVLLWSGIVANVLTLLVLKYTGFLAENLALALRLVGVHADWSGSNPFASVGVSFFVFQGISYVVDVYLETTQAERHLGFFALHMALFCKIAQGPIERAPDLLPQLRTPIRLTVPNALAGVNLLFWGLFKKVVIADRLSAFVGAVYSDVHAHEGLPLLLATYCFAAQLYFDFSGYTDMARGTARVFGLGLVENFQRPYYATSVAEFWRRWHMSFTNWVLDYVFKPLQMSLRRWRVWGTPVSLLATFLISGLWHGASWCFVVWGGMHGLFMGVSVLTGRWRRRLATRLGVNGSRWLRPFQVIVTFHLVCLAWVFFRAETLSDALYVVRSAAVGLPGSVALVARGEKVQQLLLLGQGRGEALLAVALVLFMVGVGLYRGRLSEVRESGVPTNRLVSFLSRGLRTTVAALMFYFLAFHGASAKSFIYAQF